MLVLTDRRPARYPLVRVVESAVAGGARWILLREKDLPAARRWALAEAIREILTPVGGRLVVAGPDPLGGDAVHLAAADPLGRFRPTTVGRSCHGRVELDRLSIEDYATLSPVYPSASKPGYGPPLGTALFGRLAAGTDRPVLALGGVETPARAAACLAAGAAGVAVMGAVMRAADPAAVVDRLLREVPA